MIWKLVAGIFYAEIVICTLLVFPILSARRWKRLLQSQLVTSVWSYIRFYFHLFGLLLIGLFIGSVREMRKQESKRTDQLSSEKANVVLQKLFRAQRNFYITMFAALLLYILYRIGSLILTQAALEAKEDENRLQLSAAAAAVTDAAVDERAQRSETIRLELHSAKDEIRKLKEELRDTERHKDMMNADLNNLRSELESISRSCSEKKDLLSGSVAF